MAGEAKSAVAKDKPAAGLRERSKQRRIDRIVDAALDILRENPEENLTLDRVAARAEVAPMTVFNLIGNRDQLWNAMADRAIQSLEPSSVTVEDPRERAHAIVEEVVCVLRSDPDVFRQLLAGWSQSGLVLQHDPTVALIDCLHQAVKEGTLKPDVNARKYGEVLAAGLIGTIHQWTAGLLNDRAFGTRAHAVVDVVFDAARP
ncbi:TetR/AcrR family transcriptional regulator [Mycolicibacterium sp. CH28]|uniref:TetR/AcrR family transcriptional regulator n=1 Tax=Mycolicibacterium sp. CH28 TaxID=2512237 RepID=UPI001081D71F|nr:TetR/AcrR family transcriptional regulator [Mycolicibacterium sp. CH28]TGD85957.1 TetR/AcrR family transcriptional regulator [Mycolicibacterium sp. CH28]